MRASAYDGEMASPDLQRLASRLKLRHYALLTELDRHRSVSKTAVQLAQAQPTVTRALAEIEAIFLTPLFVRGRRGLEPTPAGELVLARARLALADAAALGQDLAALGSGFQGVLRIGVIPFLSRHTQDVMWQHLLSLQPRLSFVLEETTTDLLLQAVQARRLDCAVCRFTSASVEVGLTQRHLYRQEPRLVVSRPASARLARRGLDWDAFVSMRWIFPPPHTPIREMIQAIFASAGQSVPAPVLEAYAHKTLASVLRYLPDAITILPDDIAEEVAEASGARVLPQRLQWNLPPVGLVRLGDVGNAELIDAMAETVRLAHPAQESAKRS